MKLVRKIGAQGYEWPTKLELGSRVRTPEGRYLFVTVINTVKGIVWLED